MGLSGFKVKVVCVCVFVCVVCLACVFICMCNGECCMILQRQAIFSVCISENENNLLLQRLDSGNRINMFLRRVGFYVLPYTDV